MEFNVRDRVMFMDGIRHINFPMCYPAVGTIGTIISVSCDKVLVRWPSGSTSIDDKWWCDVDQIVSVQGR